MDADEVAPEKDPAPAVTRSVKILELLASGRGEASLTEIARGIGAAKSSTSNLCAVLEGTGLITKVGGGYGLGHRILEFAGAYLRRFDEVRTFYRFCAESEVLSQEIVQIAMLDGVDVVYLARHEGTAPLRLTAGIGDRFPAAPTAVGNALLAGLDRELVRTLFSDADAFPVRTERSVRSLAALEAKLDVARERGYAVDEGEVHPGVVGIAVRIPPRSSGSAPLAIGVSLITPSLPAERRREIVDELHELARMLANPLVADVT